MGQTTFCCIIKIFFFFLGTFFCCFFNETGKLNTFFISKVCKACKARCGSHINVTKLCLGTKIIVKYKQTWEVIHQLLCIPMQVQTAITSTRLVTYPLDHNDFNRIKLTFTAFEKVKQIFSKIIIAEFKCFCQSQGLIKKYIFKVCEVFKHT